MSQSNILIIDDNRDMADGLGMLLEDEGYQVTLAYNGCDGIKAFSAGHFDLVLIDFKMPDMNGVAVLQELRKKDSMVRAIVVTGYHLEQLLAAVLDNGDVEILRKPFELECVSGILDRIGKENILLIVDDDPDFSGCLSAYLTGNGFKTWHAHNSQEAVDGVLSSPAEVLVLDLRMPIIYGLEVYLGLKQQGHTMKTIIITGCADEEPDAVDILQSISVTGCLFKPFKPESMLRAISRMMDR